MKTALNAYYIQKKSSNSQNVKNFCMVFVSKNEKRHREFLLCFLSKAATKFLELEASVMSVRRE